jgi:hypothetical protein
LRTWPPARGSAGVASHAPLLQLEVVVAVEGARTGCLKSRIASVLERGASPVLRALRNCYGSVSSASMCCHSRVCFFVRISFPFSGWALPVPVLVLRLVGFILHLFFRKKTLQKNLEWSLLFWPNFWVPSDFASWLQPAQR